MTASAITSASPSFYSPSLLRGRRVVVTGGATGICQGIAMAFAQHGAQVAVASRKKENVEAAAAQIAATGAKSLGVVMDVRVPAEVEAGLKQVAEAFGGVDIVVNGAAGNFLAAAQDLSYNGFKTVIDIDLQGTFNVCRAALPYLLQAKPSACILNISATLHYGATLMQCHVSAAKAGIDALTSNLALEWGPRGIRVNAIAPGPIGDTEGMRRLAPGALGEKIASQVPLKRLGSIDDVAQGALFLVSDAASYVSGTILVVDGGRCVNNAMYDFASLAPPMTSASSSSPAPTVS